MPDILRAWPWQCHLQKHYDEAKAQSLAWCTGFGAFDAKSQDAFDRCNFGAFVPCRRFNVETNRIQQNSP